MDLGIKGMRADLGMRTDLEIPIVVFSEEKERRIREIIREELARHEWLMAEGGVPYPGSDPVRQDLTSETPEIAADPPIVPEEEPVPHDVREDEEGQGPIPPEEDVTSGQAFVEETEVQEVSEGAAEGEPAARGPILLH
jgi:hypothetical protein